MEVIKCRTCLKVTYEHDCANVNTKCYLKDTVKEAILRLVPEMNLSLQDDDMICGKCLNTLKASLGFIETCLTVEALIAYNKNISNTLIEVPEFDTKVEEIESIFDEIDFDRTYYNKQSFTNCTYLSSDDDDDEENNYYSDGSNYFEEIIIDSSLGQNDTGDSNSTVNSVIYPTKNTVEKLKEKPPLSQQSNSGDIRFDEFHGTRRKTEEVERFEVINKDVNDFTCPICSMKFSDGDEYEEHAETHVLSCEFCGKDFSSGEENEYKAHIDKHKRFAKVCEFCGAILPDSATLRNHILWKHPTTPFKCDKCPKYFRNKYLATAHSKIVHQKSKQKQCTQCGKLFVNLETCKNHYRLVHLKLKPYLCAICGEKFGRSDYLERHKAEHGFEAKVTKTQSPRVRKGKRVPKHGVHLKDPGKPVKCNICGKEIATVHLLKGHLESHVKIKRFKCGFCNLSFSMLSNKKRHEKTHGREINKYRCNICWKWMPTMKDLEVHVNNHDRPPQHSCEMCGEKFHRKYLKEDHIAEKHISEEDIEKAVEEIVVKNLLQYANPNIL